MKELIIMRGFPWTGKSYTANLIASQTEDSVILSTDEYWYKVNEASSPEEYSFDISKLGTAHKWNQERAFEHLEKGTSCIIIDNTNTTYEEMLPYVMAAKEKKYKILIQEPTSTRWQDIVALLENKKKNEKELKLWAKKLETGSKENHNVPAFAIEKMMFRWELTEKIIRKVEQ